MRGLFQSIAIPRRLARWRRKPPRLIWPSLLVFLSLVAILPMLALQTIVTLTGLAVRLMRLRKTRAR